MTYRREKARSRGRLVLVLAVLVALIIAVGWWLGQNATIPGGGSGDESAPGSQSIPTQPESCPDVELLAVPGTWESFPGDDPFSPKANPNALLKTVTDPISQQYSPDRLKVYTVPYTAQFRNPQRPEDMTYDQSRAEGTAATFDEIVSTSAACPLTKFVLLGFSQGAVIAGDLAHQIGTSQTPVSSDRVLSSVLIADGRREPGVGQSPGLAPQNGQGMEIALQPATAITQLVAGATMTGPRPGGFGDLNDRTAEICNANDLICNAPLNAVDGAARLGEYVANDPAHSTYATDPNVIAGTTVPQWTIGHISGVVNETPEVPHDN